MLIIVEGMNGVGKSTLVSRLRLLTPGQVIHKSGPETNTVYDEYIKPLKDYRPGSGTIVICDRWHLGEIVYPLVYQRPSLMSVQALLAAESFLKFKGALLVKCTAPYHTRKFNIEKRGEPFDDDEDYYEYLLWEAAWQMSSLPTIEVPFGTDRLHDILIAADQEETYAWA